MTLDVRLRHAFAGFTLDVAFTAPAGVTALFGRSGSGKTTVINAVAGLLRPDAGRIASDGRVLFDSAGGVNVAVHRRRLGYVFQDARLFPHLTVRQNLLYGRWFAPRGPGEPLERVLDLLGIEPLLARRPGALSGGERSRVAIGRALLSKPSLMMLDEPSLGLSPLLVKSLFELIRDLNRDGLAILLVEQNTHMALATAHRAYVLELGRLVLEGKASALASDPRMAEAYLGA
jgi:molybdate transport system ATP-binding protein